MRLTLQISVGMSDARIEWPLQGMDKVYFCFLNAYLRWPTTLPVQYFDKVAH